jgi:ABC-type nickel/cobalt efflux system permease component RcnA
MNGLALALALIIGLPLTLLSLGFLIIAIKVFSGWGRAERTQTLEAARRLERTLNSLENRLGALEDIIFTGQEGGGNHETRA